MKCPLNLCDVRQFLVWIAQVLGCASGTLESAGGWLPHKAIIGSYLEMVWACSNLSHFNC